MSSTVRLTLRSSIVARLCGVGVAARAQDAAEQAANVEEIVVTGSSLRGVAPVGSNLVTVGRERDRGHRRANRAADPEDRAVRRRSAERGPGRLRQLRRRRHQRSDDSRPGRVGLEQHAGPAERPPHAGLRHQPRARRSEHHRAARARARRGAGGRRVVGLRLGRRRRRRQFHHAAQRRRRRSLGADGRRGRLRHLQRRRPRRHDLGRRLAAVLLQLLRPRQPRGRRSQTTSAPIRRRAAAATSRRTAAAPRASRSAARRITRRMRRRTPSPATAIRRCTPTCSRASGATASSRRSSRTSATD